jgi:hypothetical protein
MGIRDYHPSEQVCPSVDLGLAPPPLPEIEFMESFQKHPSIAPPQIIDGILHQGCKMVLGGPSKTNKTWCLLDLAIAVASGQTWWGRRCTKTKVLYLNFELPRWSIAQRLAALQYERLNVADAVRENLALWNLRGPAADFSLLRLDLQAQLDRHDFGLIILDPIYKVLGDRDENANGEIAGLMNELELLVQRTRAALAMAHHFAKGDSTGKHAIDRMSGAGAWARDPDSLLILTPHEEEDCYTVTSILRNLPQVPEFVLRWEFPQMRLADDLNPEALRRPQSKNKVCTDRDFVQKFITTTPTARGTIVRLAGEKGLSAPTTDRYLKRLCEAGLISSGSGTYWRLDE